MEKIKIYCTSLALACNNSWIHLHIILYMCFQPSVQIVNPKIMFCSRQESGLKRYKQEKEGMK